MSVEAKLIINVNGTEIELNREDAATLRQKLDDFLGREYEIKWPMPDLSEKGIQPYQPCPSADPYYPALPTYPSYPQIWF